MHFKFTSYLYNNNIIYMMPAVHSSRFMTFIRKINYLPYKIYG